MRRVEADFVGTVEASGYYQIAEGPCKRGSKLAEIDKAVVAVATVIALLRDYVELAEPS